MGESIHTSAAEFSGAQAETDRKQTAYAALGFGALTLVSYEAVQAVAPSGEASDALTAAILGFGALTVVTTVVSGTISGIAWQLDARRHRRLGNDGPDIDKTL